VKTAFISALRNAIMAGLRLAPLRQSVRMRRVVRPGGRPVRGTVGAPGPDEIGHEGGRVFLLHHPHVQQHVR
jgi:hypothetical protein